MAANAGLPAPKRIAYFASKGHTKSAQDLRQKMPHGWIRVPQVTDTIDVKGAKALVESLATASKEKVISAASGVVMAAEHVMTVAKKQVPVRHGVLRSSGHVKPPVFTGNAFKVEMAFGGASAPYAVHVHEDLKARHKQGTKAKFLEDPLRTEGKTVRAIIAAAVK